MSDSSGGGGSGLAWFLGGLAVVGTAVGIGVATSKKPAPAPRFGRAPTPGRIRPQPLLKKPCLPCGR